MIKIIFHALIAALNSHYLTPFRLTEQSHQQADFWMGQVGSGHYLVMATISLRRYPFFTIESVEYSIQRFSRDSTPPSKAQA